MEIGFALLGVYDIVGLYVELFFFKQKTAYGMRISDWSSDVCSSDLDRAQLGDGRLVARAVEHADDDLFGLAALFARNRLDILAHALVETVDTRGIACTNRKLIHIDFGGVEPDAFCGDLEARECLGPPPGGVSPDFARGEGSVHVG